MELFLIFGIIFLLTYMIMVIRDHYRSDKKRILPADLFVNKSKKGNSVVVKSLSTTKGAAVVNCDSKGVRVRLSRGGRFSGVVNGKLIELEGPEDKDWEEFNIKT